MRSCASNCLLAAVLFVLVTAPGYAKRTKFPPDPRFAAIDRIVVLPVVDARAGKKDNVNLDSLRKAAIKNLQHKNYEVRAGGDEGAGGDIAVEDLNEAKPDWVRRLGPPDARWVLVVVLDEAHSKITFGSTGNAEIAGFLFDKHDGSVLWRATGIGQAGQGGLAGMTLVGLMRGMALDTAMANLFSSIPKLSKRR